MADQGVGARVLRKEDDRFLHGRGQFVGARIKLELGGNLCRCTGYLGIVDEIELACDRLKEKRHG